MRLVSSHLLIKWLQNNLMIFICTLSNLIYLFSIIEERFCSAHLNSKSQNAYFNLVKKILKARLFKLFFFVPGITLLPALIIWILYHFSLYTYFQCLSNWNQITSLTLKFIYLIIATCQVRNVHFPNQKLQNQQKLGLSCDPFKHI